jgi:hypothetical protein
MVNNWALTEAPIYLGCVALLLIDQTDSWVCFWRLRALKAGDVAGLRRIRRWESTIAFMAVGLWNPPLMVHSGTLGALYLDIFILLGMHVKNPDLLTKTRAILRKWRRGRLGDANS